MNTSTFRLEEPTDMKTLNIDYDDLDYFQVSLSFEGSQCNHGDIKMGQAIDASVTIVQKCLIIRFLRQETYWLPIFSKEVIIEDRDCIIKVIDDNENNICTLKFKPEQRDDFFAFLQKIIQVCIIKSPTLETYFQFQQTLGKGSQASVSLYQPKQTQMHWLKNESFAVKTYYLENISQMVEEMIIEEISLLRELKICDNIIQLEQIYRTPTQMHLVMRYAEYGSLNKYLTLQGSLAETQIKEFMGQILLAIDLMHHKNILHRDIKPDNILINNKIDLQMCIADFGFVCKMDDKIKIYQKCGTPGYVAPEILQGLPFSNKSDIFSIGCLFYNMITGKPLFQGRNNEQILAQNKQQNSLQRVERTVNSVSQNCKDLLKRMLSYDPRSRPSAEECLQHSWFLSNFMNLENMLFVNRNSYVIDSLNIQLASSQYEEEAFDSFVLGPNYFQSMDRSNRFESLNIQIDKRKSQTRSKKASPQLRIGYNSNKRSNSIDPSLLQCPQVKNECKKMPKTFSQLEENQYIQECKEEESHREMLDSKLSLESYDMQELDEYSPRAPFEPLNDIDYKVSQRFQLIQNLTSGRSMQIRNKTYTANKRKFLNI